MNTIPVAREEKVLDFPVESVRWEFLSYEQAVAHLHKAIEVAKQEVPYRRLKLARETLENLAKHCPFFNVRGSAQTALLVYFGEEKIDEYSK